MCSAAISFGSSPLARGLLDKIGVVNAHGGIIPARAGFTPPLPGSRRELWDHPRSRGVYMVPESAIFKHVGSSPLARGLRLNETRVLGLGGIIPARAGFTAYNIAGNNIATDHPRSRGVYRAFLDAGGLSSGSSPLARGLRGGGVEVDLDGRIIPARAGFTPAYVLRHTYHTDHPRSRGVYAARRIAGDVGKGSSPLARGLPRTPCRTAQYPRIIPARAGFTYPCHTGTRTPQDHPRSRGVYGRLTTAQARAAGSSPLARGLQMIAQIRGPLIRIIPARAGFT